MNLLLLSQESQEKTITHYQFTGWPDHDVPQTTEPLLSFLRKVPDLSARNPISPILTHCRCVNMYPITGLKYTGNVTLRPGSDWTSSLN